MLENHATNTMWPIRIVTEQMGLSKTTVYRRISQKLFPPPVKLGRPSRWPSDEVLKIIAAYTAGLGEEEIRGLVRQLKQDRQRRNI